MSTRGAYELPDGTLVRTQGEVPKGAPIVKIGIPVGHQELIDYINGIMVRERANGMQSIDSHVERQPFEVPFEQQKEATPPPPPPPPAAPKVDESQARLRIAQQMRGLETEAIEQRILEAKGPAFAKFMLAGIERLAGLGKEGWAHMQAYLQLHHAQIGVYDRGLHMLALLQIEAMNTPPAERGKIAPVREKAA